MDRINISVIDGKKYRVLSGVDLGRHAREEFRLDLFDKQQNEVVFFIPEDVLSVNSSFFSGLFQASLKNLGEKEFRKRYKFECDNIIMMNIENGISTNGIVGKLEPDAVDIVVHVDRDILKWLCVDKFPNDPKELEKEIRMAIYHSYECMKRARVEACMSREKAWRLFK